MSAPTHEAPPVSEQPTQPLPIAAWDDHLPSRGLTNEAWIPGVIAAAIISGTVIREFLTVDGRFVFAVLALGGVLLLALLVTSLGALHREDGRQASVGRER